MSANPTDSRRGNHPNSLAALEQTQWKQGQSGNPGGQPKNTPRVADAYKRIITMSPDEFRNFKPSNVAEVMALRQVTEAIANKKPLAYAQEVTNRTDGPIVRKVEKVDLTLLEAERQRFQAAVDALVEKRGCSRADAAIVIATVMPSYKKFLETEAP